MGDQALDVEPARLHRLDRAPQAGRVDRRIPLVRVDHVEPVPVPQLHVHAAPAVLVIADDDQAPTHRGQARGEVERLLVPGRLEHDVERVAIESPLVRRARAARAELER
jgi:hypothetical protein